MMVDVDEDFPVADARDDPAQALKTRAIRGNDAVELHAAFGFLEQSVAVQKFVLLRDGILIPAGHFFALVLQGQRETKLRPDTIAIGPDVSGNAESFALADRSKNTVNDFGITFHNLIFKVGGGRGFFQFLHDLQHSVAAHDGIVEGKFQLRRVFQDDGLADEPLDAHAMLGEQLKAALLLVGIAEDADENGRGLEIAGHVDVVDRNQTAFAHMKFAADGFADFTLQQFTHALES